jgi:hypothetical protein
MKWLQIVLGVFGMMTPQLRAEFKVFFDNWEAKAKTTTNPMDDVVVAVLRGLLGV